MHHSATETFPWLPTISPRKGNLHLIFGQRAGTSQRHFCRSRKRLKPFAPSYLIDFPGFGQSPIPPQNWGNAAEYADAVATWMKSLGPENGVWMAIASAEESECRLASGTRSCSKEWS